MTPELLTPAEVAALLRVPELTLVQWRTSNTGPRSAKIGRHRRYARSDVEAFIESRMNHPSEADERTARYG